MPDFTAAQWCAALFVLLALALVAMRGVFLIIEAIQSPSDPMGDDHGR